MEFRNTKVQELARNINFNWDYASPAHHQTIWCVERANQTLWNKIKKLCHYGQKCWERVVPRATLAVNISFNRAIGCFPYELRFGAAPQLPIDDKMGTTPLIIKKDELLKRRQRVQQKYLKDIIKGKVEIRDEFSFGDKVLVFKKNLKNKLLSGWTSGYIVIDKVEPYAYIVKSKAGKFGINKRHLKLDRSNLGGEVSQAS